MRRFYRAGILPSLVNLITGLMRVPGRSSEYGIKRGYKSRLENDFFDDTVLQDEYQREVYEFAESLFRRQNLKEVIDVGCGSGYKLRKHFQPQEATGYDLEPTVGHLRRNYPDWTWFHADQLKHRSKSDLIICADVIEHLTDPTPLLVQFQSIQFQYLIISTPDRHQKTGRWDFGPPFNPAHVREWNQAELKSFLGHFFRIENHFLSNVQQGTQLILCRPY